MCSSSDRRADNLAEKCDLVFHMNRIFQLEWGRGICPICKLYVFSGRIQMTFWIFCSSIYLDNDTRGLSED